MRLEARLATFGTSTADASIAASVTLLSLLDVNSETTMHVWIARVAIIAVVMSLAWRRQAPLPILLAVCSLNLVLSATAPGPFPPQLLLLAVLLAIASAAYHLERHREVWTGGLGSLALVFAAHASTADGDTGDFLPFVLWGGAWVAGRMVRHRTLVMSRLAAETALLGEQREAAAREELARERDSIARELHDIVAHAVSLMVIQAGAERLSVEDDRQRTKAVLDTIESTGREALQELRAMLAVLRDAPQPSDPGAVAPQPSIADIPALVNRVRDAGLPVVLHQDLDLPAVAPGVGLAAFRLVQESLTNSLKHAQAMTEVSVGVDADVLQIEVRNPYTLPPVERAAGRGIVGMRERVLLHGGSCEIGPQGGSWVVHARLPLTARGTLL